MGKIAIVFLCSKKPPAGFMDFAQELERRDKYEVFYVVDDNKHFHLHLDRFTHKFIQIPNNEAKTEGFWGSVLYYPDRPCAKDKALYYFCRIDREYEFVWLIEQDVFIPSNQTLEWMDTKYPNTDLLSPHFSVRVVENEPPKFWHWKKLRGTINLPEPWANGMTCAVRVSRTFLNQLNNYVTINRRLFMDEILFATMAMHNNLSAAIVPELKEMAYRKDFIYNDVQDLTRLYHPIKNQQQQLDYRMRLVNHIPPDPVASPTFAPTKFKHAPSPSKSAVAAVVDSYILLTTLALCVLVFVVLALRHRRSKITDCKR